MLTSSTFILRQAIVRTRHLGLALLLGSTAACEPSGAPSSPGNHPAQEPTQKKSDPAAVRAPSTSMADHASKPAAFHYLVRLGHQEGKGLRLVGGRRIEDPAPVESGTAWQRRAWRLEAYDAAGAVVYQTGFDDPALLRLPGHPGSHDKQGNLVEAGHAPAAVRMTEEAQWLVHVPATAATIKVFRLRPGNPTQAQIREGAYETLGTVQVDPSSFAVTGQTEQP